MSHPAHRRRGHSKIHTGLPWEVAAASVVAGPKPREVEYVYFVQAEDGGPVKIGRSRDPKHRLKQMQTGHSGLLRITRTVAVHRSKSALMEQNIHKRFEDIRIRGEWFEPNDELRALAHAV